MEQYALNLGDDGRILSATFERFAPAGAVIVAELPQGDITEYRFVDGEYVHEPLPKATPEATPSIDDILIEAVLDLEYRMILMELGVML